LFDKHGKCRLCSRRPIINALNQSSDGSSLQTVYILVVSDNPNKVWLLPGGIFQPTINFPKKETKICVVALYNSVHSEH
jgi:hypothetical protein